MDADNHASLAEQIAEVERTARDYNEWSARELSCATQAAIRARAGGAGDE